MKRLSIAFAGLLLVLPATAQTYVQYALTNFVGTTKTNIYGTNTYLDTRFIGSLTIDVPTNTLATIINAQGTANIEDAGPKIQYAGYPQLESGGIGQGAWQSGLSLFNIPILGPATITYVPRSHTDNNGNNPGALTNLLFMSLVKFEAVNTTPAIAGFAVQPANNSATIGLETSTDLAT